jgi:hypothetical protein
MSTFQENAYSEGTVTLEWATKAQGDCDHFTPRNYTSYPLYRRLGGPQRQSNVYAECV